MKILDVLKRANHNAWSRKARSVLTILSIVVGSMSLTLAIGLGAGAQNLVQTNLNNAEQNDNAITVNKIPEVVLRERAAGNKDSVPLYNPDNQENQARPINSSPVFISQAEQYELKKIDGVQNVSPVYQVKAVYVSLDGQNYLANISTAEKGTVYKPISGSGDLNGNRRGILLSESYAESAGISAQQLVGREVQISFGADDSGEEVIKTLPIVGVMADPFNNYPSYVSYAVMEEVAKELGQTDTSEVTVLLDSSSQESVFNVTQQIEALNKQYFTTSSYKSASETESTLGTIRLVLIAFALIVFTAAVFGIANTLLTSVLERTKDIGLMKALGMKRKHVFRLFAFESGIIGFWGGVIGVAFGVGIGLTANALLGENTEFGGANMFLFQPLALLVILLVSMFISFLAGALPARKAARTNIIDALRYE